MPGVVPTAVAAATRSMLFARRRSRARQMGWPIRGNATPAWATRPIEAIEVGDLVWAWDEALAHLVRRPVVRLFRHRGQPIVAVTVVDAAGASHCIESTTEHPFWVDAKGWVAACQLQGGDLLQCIGEGTCLRVASVQRTGNTADVFNFEVSGVHNYFVGAQGVLVHNESAPAKGSEASRSWKVAGDEKAKLAKGQDHVLDTGDGPPPMGRPVARFDALAHAENQISRANRTKVIRVASRVALGASLVFAFGHTVQKYRGTYSEAVANASSAAALSPAGEPVGYGAWQYKLTRPQLTLRPEIADAMVWQTPLRLAKPDWVVQGERLAPARDAKLANEPLELMRNRQFAEAPAKLGSGGGLMGAFQKYEPITTAHDFEVVQARIRQHLRAGELGAAQALAHDADIGLSRYNELVDDTYVPMPESPYKTAARALWTDGQFQADFADVGGRALVASGYGAVPVLGGPDGKGVIERGRMFVSSALWLGYGLSESIDIARYGSGGYSGATSHAEAWRTPMLKMTQRAIYNMASEQAGMFLPAPGVREAQSLGRWTMAPTLWSRPAMQYLGMAATDTALGVVAGQAVGLWRHQVDPATPSPYENGGLWSNIVPDAAANVFAYTLMSPGATSALGMSRIPWEYKAAVLVGGRAIATETYNQMTSP